MRVGVFFGENFEEVEALTVVDYLKRAGNDVEMVSIGHSHLVGGAHGVVIKTDFVIDEVWLKTYDMLVLPGGSGHKNLEKCNLLMKYVKKFAEEGKFVAAICASPSILGRAGILQGKRVTCYPGYEAECKGATCTGAECEWDGNIITGRSAGAANAFALKLIEALNGRDKAEELAKQIVYDYLK